MKTYPEIPSQIRRDMPYYLFDKLDGSNIRAEWSKKNGFYKFGTRHQLLDESYPHPFLAESIPLIRDIYEDEISRIMIKERESNGIFFFEFYGPNSFAGYHYEEPHTVTLFDASIYKKGFLPPGEFCRWFDGVPKANLLYYGKINSMVIEKIKDGSLPGQTFEGVVCKAKHPKKGQLTIMFKIKSQAWYDKLHERCGDDEKLYKELA